MIDRSLSNLPVPFTWSLKLGLLSLIPTLPPSFIVKTSAVLSNTFTKSAFPVPLMNTTGLWLLSETKKN